MSISQDEANPYAQGFDRYYAREVAPALEKLEDRRRTGAHGVIALCILAALGPLAVFGGEALSSLTGLRADIFQFGGFAVLFGAVAGAVYVYKRVHGAFKDVLVGKTCDFLGLDFQAKDFSFPLDRFRAARIVPDHDKRTLEDRISGEHAGVPFELCEARLKKTRTERDNDGNTQTETVDVFQGLLLIYRFPKRFNGRTVVVPDLTWLGNKLGGMGQDGERVTLEDVRFERQFEVYSDDQVEARYLLTPRFMERLTELAGQFGNPRGLSLAFDGQDLLIAVRSKEDRFEGGHIFKSFLERERAEELLDELALVFEIVDILNLADRSGAA